MPRAVTLRLVSSRKEESVEHGIPTLPNERRGAPRFDKAIPVFVTGSRGVICGIARNISDGGMFVELREPYPLGTRVRVTFAAPGVGTEVTVEAEVRYQCFINYCGPGGTRQGLRGMGVRFLGMVTDEPVPRGQLH
jgi:hypothetical protein